MFKVPKVIDTIQFGILSPEDVRKMSVLRVITADTYDDDGYPIEKGLMDQRLGVIDPGLKCKTCGQKFGDCPGHFGHIELARPVVHVGHAKDVHKMLKGVCSHCGSVTLEPKGKMDYLRDIRNSTSRFKDKDTISKEALSKADHKKRCFYCGTEIKSIKFEKPYTFYEETPRISGGYTKKRENLLQEKNRLIILNNEKTKDLGEKIKNDLVITDVKNIPNLFYNLINLILEKNNKIEEYSDELERTQNEIDSLIINTNRNFVIPTIEKEIEEINSKIDTLQKERSEIEEKIKLEKEELSRLKIELNKLTLEIDEYEREKSNLDKIKEGLSKEKEKLEKTIIAENNLLEIEKETAENNLLEIEKEIDSLKLDSTKKEYSAQIKIILKLYEDIGELGPKKIEKEIKNIYLNYGFKEKDINKIVKITAQIKELTDQKQPHEEAAAKITAQIKELTDQKQPHEEAAAKITAQIKELTDQKQPHEEAAAKITAQIKELTDQKQPHEEAAAKITAQIKELTDQKQLHEEAAAKITAQIKELTDQKQLHEEAAVRNIPKIEIISLQKDILEIKLLIKITAQIKELTDQKQPHEEAAAKITAQIKELTDQKQPHEEAAAKITAQIKELTDQKQPHEEAAAKITAQIKELTDQKQPHEEAAASIKGYDLSFREYSYGIAFIQNSLEKLLKLIKSYIHELSSKIIDISKDIDTLEKKIEKIKKNLEEVKMHIESIKESIKPYLKRLEEIGEMLTILTPEERNKLTPIDVRERLEKIPLEDYELIGINKVVSKPEWMVLTVLPVPPVTVRPSITLESSVRSEDDLTHKLVDIIRINQRLRENIDAGAPQLIVEDLWELLQYHITTYFNNSTSGIPPARHRSGRILKTISQRLSGKEGRFRSNLSGKRVDFSARTVVSPDPYISINEVGVPDFVASELTVPEKVTAHNLEEMKIIVRNGPNKHPGANYVIRNDERRKKITDTTKADIAEELDVGFTVERQLRDGDIVLFNRQPSLHRLSIMAHEVRVMPYKTFRLNLCVCPPYNADFDGDEMNLHLPQTEEARAEAGIIMKVQENIISPRFGEPVIGGMQDYISGAYLMTKDGAEFSPQEAQESFYESGILNNKLGVEAFEDRTKQWTGKELFEVLLPKDLSVEFRSKTCRKCEKCEFANCKFDNYVVIKEGKLLHGVIDGAAFKARSNCKLLDKIVKDYGSDEGREFLDSVTKLIISVIMKVGLTTGIDDVDIPEEGLERIDEILENARNKVMENIDAYNRGELEKQPGQTIEDTLENRIMAELAKARDNAGAAAEQYLGMKRHAVIMAKTGAKGNMLDLTQMAACLGQMTVRGKRLHRGYQERSLPHFKRGDRSAKARGFVSSSYRKGLSPTEFFFHSMGGREGLVDTAVRTAQSGYMQRRLINALQDLKVEKDRSVRDNSNNIIQFEYGEDGVDPSRSSYGEAVDIDWIIHKTITSRKE